MMIVFVALYGANDETTLLGVYSTADLAWARCRKEVESWDRGAYSVVPCPIDGPAPGEDAYQYIDASKLTTTNPHT